jgi:hypothetical protein
MTTDGPIRSNLRSLSTGLFVSRWLLERVPHVFAGDLEAYVDWKHALSDRIFVDPKAITLVGSGASGYSLSPNKALKPFHAGSDIDVAVVSAHHFDVVWRWLRTLGSERYGWPRYVQEQIGDHRQRLVYWGAIATDRILQYTPLGKDWVPALADLANTLPGGRRDINVRLFREFEALRAYQVHGCAQIRAKL